MSLTQPGMAVGTPYYISPEQAKGEQVDSRSDLYSLGATLYHMVVGQVPYDGDSPTQILIQHVTAEIPMACEHREDVSILLSEIICKLLNKLPEDRYQSPNELITELEKLQSGATSGGEMEADKDAGGNNGEMESPIASYQIIKVLG